MSDATCGPASHTEQTGYRAVALDWGRWAMSGDVSLPPLHVGVNGVRGQTPGVPLSGGRAPPQSTLQLCASLALGSREPGEGLFSLPVPARGGPGGTPCRRMLPVSVLCPQNPDIVLVHYLNVPAIEDCGKPCGPILCSINTDKKEWAKWTKEELVGQLKPMCE